MIDSMPIKLPANAHFETTRHGKRVIYYREGKGPRTRLPDDPRSDEFREEYKAAVRGEKPAPKKKVVRTSSLEWLIERYKLSAAWLDLKPATREQRTNIFKGVVAKSGSVSFANLKQENIQLGMNEREHTPAQANNFLKAMRQLFEWAIKEKHIETNPCNGVERFKLRETGGFPAWTVEDVIAFRTRHEPGTMARLAMELFLATGLRRGDLVTAGRQHLRGNVFSMQTEKTGAWVTVELSENLMKLIETTKTGELNFIVGAHGRKFTKESFGNWFADRCREAGIQKNAHGLRKLSSTLAAEGGLSARRMMAMYGWSNIRQAEVYTRAADDKRMGIESSRVVAEQIENIDSPHPDSGAGYERKKATKTRGEK